MTASSAIVAGSSGSLGVAIAQDLAARGIAVFGVDRVSRPDFPGIFVRADLSDSNQMEIAIGEIADRVPTKNSLALVNAAGSIASAPLVSYDAGGRLRPHPLDLWQQILEGNLNPLFVATSVFSTELLHRRWRGVVVSIGSVAARGHSGQVAYAAAKGATVSFMNACAMEMGPFGIRFVTIEPGYVDVDSTRQAMGPHRLADIAKSSSLRKLVDPQSISEAVWLAICAESITGTVIRVDSGLT